MQLHFIRPEWLMAFVPLGVLWWILLRRWTSAGNWQAICDPHLLPHLLVRVAKRHGVWPLWLLGLVWLFTVLALAGPTWSQAPQPMYGSPEARVIVLDLSPAMSVTDIRPNRLERAKYKVLDIFKRNYAGQVGMVVFAGESYLVSPLTQDAATIAAQIAELNPDIMPVRGSDMSKGLVMAGRLFQQAGVRRGEILIMTANPANPDSLAKVQRLHRQGLTFSVLEFGSAHAQSLTQLAQNGGGYYASFTNDDTDLDRVLTSEATQPFSQQTKMVAEASAVWRDQGQWFIVLMLPFVAVLFRRGWLEKL